jgi:hypothetical protein
MIRTVLVLIHVAAGVGGLITGLVALAPPKPTDNRQWLRRLYATCIAVLLTAMVVLVAIDWADLDAIARVAFAALTGLGGVMAYRLVRAHREVTTQRPNWQERYIDHIFFTYISLWEGFVILPALNLPASYVTVPFVAISVLLLGHALISRYKARILVNA